MAVFKIFPVADLGSSFANFINRGYLYGATRSLTKERISSGVVFAPERSPTTAATSSPKSG